MMIAQEHPAIPHSSYIIVKRRFQLSDPWWIESRRKFTLTFSPTTRCKIIFEKDELRVEVSFTLSTETKYIVI